MKAKQPLLYCIEKHRLIQEFAHAVIEHHHLLQAQVDQMMKGNISTAGLELDIMIASSRREETKYAIIAHASEHG